MQLRVGNDNGNSEQDIVINGKVIVQPNVYAKVTRLPRLEELNPKYVAENIHDNLIVTITSNEVNSGTPTSYFVGKYAIKSGKSLHDIAVGVDNSKISSELPTINTLANIGGYAAAEAYKEDSAVEKVDLKVDMVTALPVNQYSSTNAATFTKRFLLTPHEVVVHLGDKKVKVNIEFEYVKTSPEAVPTVFYLGSLVDRIKKCNEDIAKHTKKKDTEKVAALEEDKEQIQAIFTEFMEEYEVSIEDMNFRDMKVLHIAIGEGTTEYPITQGETFNINFITGTNNGVGHAIERVIGEFRSDKGLTSDFVRQNYSEALKNPMDKYHSSAVEYIQDELESQARTILNVAKKEIGKANNDVDCICVYGGGSILMKEYLYKPLKEFAKMVDIKVLYIPTPYSVEAEALGMYEFVNHEYFAIPKAKYLAKKNNI